MSSKSILESKFSVFIFTVVTVISLIVGWINRREYWMTPEYGTGYWFGIIGGVMMLVLIIYPARKKAKSMRGMFLIKHWFQWHMILGIVGPVLILYHCNFQLGATNSNVALFAMILVVVSGLIGRYVYKQYHEGLYGSEMNYKEMRQKYDTEKEKIMNSRYLSKDIKSRLSALEDFINDKDESVSNQWRIANSIKTASKLVMQQIRKEIKVASRMEPGGMAVRQLKILESHLKIETEILKKMSRYSLYSHLFSIWHILHFPLFIMLIITAIIHVVAVHMY